MKGILAFNLNNNEDKTSFMLANQSLEMWCALNNTDNLLRNVLKHGVYVNKKGVNINLTNNQIDVIEYIRQEFHDIIQDINVE